MPKTVDYPRTSLKKAVECSDKVATTNGGITMPGIATLLESKAEKGSSGALRDQCTAAAKFGLIRQDKGKYFPTDLGLRVANAYSDEEKKELLRQAFLHMPVYDKVARKLNGSEVPSHLGRFLIRECGVPTKIASRLANFFVKEGRNIGIIDENGRIVAPTSESEEEVGETGESENDASVSGEGFPEPPPANEHPPAVQNPRGAVDSDGIRIRIWGAGRNHELPLDEEDDLVVVEAILRKVHKALQEKRRTEADSEE